MTDTLDQKYDAARAALEDLDASLAATITAGADPGTRVARMAARQGRPQPLPGRPASSASRPVVVSAMASRRAVPGTVLTSRDDLAEVMGSAIDELRRTPGDVKFKVARAAWDYPSERRLEGDAEANGARIEAVCSSRAITASGGVCLPVNVDYAVPTWAVADRPLRDALPAFQADRGGLRYVTPPDVSALASATSIWTEATDANPASSTKPVLVVACGTEQLVYVDAVPTRLQFGNLQSRFAPEQIAANTDLAVAAAARVADLNLLSHIDASCTEVTSAQVLGTTRDLLATLDLVSAAYRFRHRVPRSVSLSAIFPDWVKDAIRADRVRELAHDSQGVDPLGVTDADIDAWFAARGVTPIWMLDGAPAETTGATYPLQGWGTQSAAAVSPWPTKLVWRLFVEGTFQFLDGGRLDLGVVRDSVLDATNDYETFIETFEGVAFRGIEALRVVTTTSAIGGSGATVSVSTGS